MAASVFRAARRTDGDAVPPDITTPFMLSGTASFLYAEFFVRAAAHEQLQLAPSRNVGKVQPATVVGLTVQHCPLYVSVLRAVVMRLYGEHST